MSFFEQNALRRGRTHPIAIAQRGVTLFTVLVVMLLCTTAVMASFRVGLLNEMLAGNTADYHRTKAAAEAMMRDAEIDVRGRMPPYASRNSDGSFGTPCNPEKGKPSQTAPGYVGCRNQGAGSAPWFPQAANLGEEFDAVQSILSGADAFKNCKAGICMPPDTNSLANIEDDLDTLQKAGAMYGQFTRQFNGVNGNTGNPSLNWSTSIKVVEGKNVVTNLAKAWYVVEVFLVEGGGFTSNAAVDRVIPAANFGKLVYRITAVATGIKSNTKVVLKSYFVPFPQAQDN